MSLIVREYMCPSHGRFDVIEPSETPTDSEHLCEECGAPSEFVLSAPKWKRQWAVAGTTAKSDAPPSPYYMETSPFAEGEDQKFYAQRKKLWQETRDAQIKKATS